MNSVPNFSCLPGPQSITLENNVFVDVNNSVLWNEMNLDFRWALNPMINTLIRWGEDTKRQEYGSRVWIAWSKAKEGLSSLDSGRGKGRFSPRVLKVSVVLLHLDFGLLDWRKMRQPIALKSFSLWQCIIAVPVY